MSVVPFIEGDRILEIGHGPGHLQRVLLSRGLFAIGLDESAAMGRLARCNLIRPFESNSKSSANEQNWINAYAQIRLTRGLAQYLPFLNDAFDTLVATFPAEYIFDPKTLTEAYRVLKPNGKFIILPGATILGRGILDRLMASLFRITGQVPPNLADILRERSKEPLGNAGFHVQIHENHIKSSMVFILVATKIYKD